MTPQPTGRVERHGDRCTVVLSRTFDAPIDQVWAAVTESDRTARWFGPWSGDPTTGRVTVILSAEDGAPPSEIEIRECRAPHSLRTSTQSEGGEWLLDLELAEVGGSTTLTLTHPDVDPAMVEAIGPGWEYYLDRLVAAETGGDPSAVDFERDYFPAMAEHYRAH